MLMRSLARARPLVLQKGYGRDVISCFVSARIRHDRSRCGLRSRRDAAEGRGHQELAVL